MDIDTLLPIFKITDSTMASKAHEFARQSRIRIRSMGEAEICRNVVCLHLAALECNKTEFPESLALKYSGTTEKIYQKTFQLLRNTLGVRSVRLEQLVVQFGCMSIMSYALDVLKAYNSRNETTKTKQGPTAAIVAAILLLCAKRRRISLDIKELVKRCQILARDLKQACCLVEDVCGDVLGEVPNSPKKQVRKRRSKRPDSEVEPDLPDGDTEEAPSQSPNENAPLTRSKRRKPDPSPEREEPDSGAIDPALSYLFSGSLL